MPNKTIILPGLSYIPDPIICYEKDSVQRKVAWEFIDFLNCLTDLLNLMHTIKVKHLRTMHPIPFEVIREIRLREVTSHTVRTHMIIFERNLRSSSCGISPSVENLLGGNNPKPRFAQKIKSHSGVNSLIKNSNKKAEEEHSMMRLSQGKKIAPLWHSLAREKHVTVAMVKEEEIKKEQKMMKDLLSGNIKSDHAFLIKEEDRRPQDFFSIKFAIDRRGREPSQAQKDIMEAYAAGFTSVETYRSYRGMLEPCWYTDLIQNSMKTGIHQTPQLVAAFERLGKFFDVNCASILQPRAKLCIILHSLPMWDATRTTMQRAAEFILSDILLVPDPGTQLKDWIEARRVPYCVLPPVFTDRGKTDSVDSDESTEAVAGTTLS